MKIGKDNQPEDLLKDSQEQIQPEQPKKTFSDKLENFWYFYKWHTIIGAVVAIGIIISVLQLVINPGSDAYMMFVGQNTLFAVDKEEIASIAGEYINDVDNDGKKHLTLLEITVAVGEDIPQTAYQTNSDATKRFTTEITAGESVIYLLEESYYDRIRGLGILEKIGDIIDPDLIPNYTYDEYGVRVGELDFFKQSGYKEFPDNTILCIRRSPDKDTIDYGRTMEKWNSNKKLFTAMFSYKVEKTEPSVIPVFNIKKSDVSLMYCGYDRVYETTGDKLARSAKSIITDRNSDGKQTLALDYRILTERNGKTAYESNACAASYLMNQANNSCHVIYLLEESFYNELLRVGKIRSLEETFGKEPVEATALLNETDGYGIRIEKLDFFKDKEFFADFDKGLYLCAVNNNGKTDDELYNESIKMFIGMVSYRSVLKESQ